MSDNPFDKNESHPSVSFGGKDPQTGAITSVPIGTRKGGTVVETPKMVQARDFVTKQPTYWDPAKRGAKTSVPNDRPCQTVVTVLEMDQGGEGQMGLWAPDPSSMFAAIRDAIAETGGAAIALGDKLYVTLVGYKQGEDTSKAAAKQYKAEIIRGAGAFAAPAPPAAPAAAPAPPPPAAVPAPPAAVPPPPPAPPADPHAAERQSFLAAGWTLELIAQHHPHLMPPAVPAPPVAPPPPPAVPAPPAPPLIPAQESREEALAKLSPEDRALLGI